MRYIWNVKILVVTATPEEQLPPSDFRFPVSSLVTGVGMVNTALIMGKKLATGKFDLAINIGLAGSFFKDIRIGSVVNITRDHFPEMGAEDGNVFLSLEELGLGHAECIPKHLFRNPIIDKLPLVSGITVNTVHGNEESISMVFERFHPFVESMEGAAFFRACNEFNLPCVQLRAISNYVTRRNKESWDIPGALKNLHAKTLEILNSL